MNVAVKIIMFQDTHEPAALVSAGKPEDASRRMVKQSQRQLVLREAAVCYSMSHPNVVATYHYELLQVQAFHQAPSGLNISDHSGSGAFKLYLIQVSWR